MKYHIVTWGCQMNVHDSEKIAGILEEKGYSMCENRKDADIIVFNTCAIREGAETKVFGNIGDLKRLKRENPNLIIAICGCMTQKKEESDLIQEKFPFVDIILGTFNMPRLGEALDRLEKQRKKQREIFEEGDIDEQKPYHRTSGENAWVNIMHGCNNFCTYCIVPFVRGREKSREKQAVLDEIKNLVKSGEYKKITLLGQNVNSYGKDLKNPVSFASLLKEICQIEGDFQLTFMTSHPKDLSDEVIDVIANESKILKEIHLPAQSGNDRILKKMNRNYTREKYLQIIKKIKEKMPNAKITSDFIVGFPTETEEEFLDTCSLVKEVLYDGIFAFIYSKRKGTIACDMEGQIDDETKRKRVNRLLQIEREIQKEKKLKG